MTLSNPLFPVHEAANAEFQAYGDLQIPQTFGLPQVEYAAIHKAAAIMDNPQRGFIELTGKDRLPFLNNLLTNQTYNKAAKEPLPAHSGVYSFLLNTKGRVVTDMNVLELGDRTLLELDARLVSTVEPMLQKYLFVDQVKIGSLIGKLHLLSLHGPTAADVLAKQTADPAKVAGALRSLAYLASMTVDLSGTSVIVYRDDVCGVPGYHLLTPPEAVGGIWGRLTGGEGGGEGEGNARPTGWAAFNTVRIENGRPLFGVDFDDTVLPAETSQVNRAVSFTKGCYLGQEIVARMHARNQVARMLVGFKMTDGALPLAGAQLMDADSNAIGVVTSSTVSPILSNAAIGLGFVKKPWFAAGTKLRLPAEGAIRDAVVVDLPFTRQG